MDCITEAVARHERIALQFSGGKDSMVTLDIMRPHLDSITVYWCNPGEPLPETIEFIKQVAATVPHFVEIDGRVRDVVQAFGFPVECVPHNAGYAAHISGIATYPLMQDRNACCMRSMMQPMQERMIEDGITLIVRGQKNSDSHKGTLRSGDIVDGVEYLYPIYDMNDAAVFSYLKERGIRLPSYYEDGSHAGDCATCTGWGGSDEYLRRNLPDQHSEYQKRIALHRQAMREAGYGSVTCV